MQTIYNLDNINKVKEELGYWIISQIQCVQRHFLSVLWHCWLGDRKGIRPGKSWVLVCWWWWFDYGASHDIQHQLSPPLPSSLAAIKPSNPGWREKWPLNRTQRMWPLSSNLIERDIVSDHAAQTVDDCRQRYSSWSIAVAVDLRRRATEVKHRRSLNTTHILPLSTLTRAWKEPKTSKNKPNLNPKPKYVQEPEPKKPTHKDSNRTRTQMSRFLLGSFTEWNCRYIHTFHSKWSIIYFT